MNDGCTPLCIASQNGHLELAERLLGAGAVVDAAESSALCAPARVRLFSERRPGRVLGGPLALWCAALAAPPRRSFFGCVVGAWLLGLGGSALGLPGSSRNDSLSPRAAAGRAATSPPCAKAGAP